MKRVHSVCYLCAFFVSIPAEHSWPRLLSFFCLFCEHCISELLSLPSFFFLRWKKKKGLVVGNSTYNLHALVQNSFSSFLLYLPLLPVFGGSASLLHWLSHSWRRSPQPLQELRSQAWHGHKNWCGQMGPCYHWKRVQQSDCSATMLLRAVVFRQTKTTYLFKEQCARICCSAIALHW